MDGILDVSEGCRNAHSFYFKEKETGRPLELITGCHCRIDVMCPECARKWRLLTRKRYISMVRRFQEPRFMTLTLRKDYQGHCENVKQLWKFRKDLFRQLRDRGYTIRGYVATVELPNHMHLIVDCDYIPQKEISEIWLDITGDSYIVDIRARDRYGKPLKDNLKLAAAYITKYVTKLTHIPYATGLVLKGFHLIGSFFQKQYRIVKKKRIARFVRIDRLEFEAIFLDFYESYPIPPDKPRGLYIFDSNV